MKIDEVFNAVEKAHSGVVYKMDTTKSLVRDRLSSGSLLLDRALGGGFVKGTITEIYGLYSSGKSTICLHAMAEAQKEGIVLFVDTERAFDPMYAKALGVNIKDLIICQPEYSEQAFDVIEAFAKCPDISMIVLDSIASLLPKAEMEGNPGDANMGVAARLNHQHARRVVAPLSNNKIVALYTNKITYKITSYGNPETTAGGTAFDYSASTRIKTTKTSTRKETLAKQSIECTAEVTKNKTFIPFQVAVLNIDFGKGINKGKELLELGVENGVIEKSGAWYSIGEERIGQGKDNASQTLMENKEWQEKIMGVKQEEKE